MTPTTHRLRTATAAVAVLAAAALAGPSVVSAATTTAFNPTTDTITITGDAAGDQIVISDAGGLLKQTLNGGAATDLLDDQGRPLPADGTVNVVVNAGDGADTVTIATAQAQSVTVDGGAGEDTITGSPGNDVLRGGPDNDHLIGAAGDDRLIGDGGRDDMDGGAGNDTLVWNNGDGSDTMDGDAGGGDEVEVNGAAGPEDAFKIAPNGGRVQFDRTNLVPFTLDIDAERITVNGLQGDDSIEGSPGLAGLITMTLNGGQGADKITGGDGPDVINGGDGSDDLSGGAGNDRIVGDRGADTMSGDDGDDTTVWNNGDGSDRMDGGNGIDRAEVNGAAGQGDAFTIAPNGARAKFDRTNLVPFTLDIGSEEALDVRGAGGDDTFAAQPGTSALLAVTADGGPGNDALTGAEEADSFFGGSGNDTLDGGPGPDLLDGQDGDDTLHSRDGQSDLVRGGAGTDSGVLDALGTDVWDSIENVDAPVIVPPPAPPAPDTTATAVRLAGSGKVKVRGGRASVRLAVSCPAAEPGGCKGTLALFTARPVKVGGDRLIVRLGGASYSLRAGETKTLKIKLPKGVRKLVKGRSLSARAETLTRDASGNTAASSRTVKLRLPR